MDLNAERVKSVAVIGAGLMGHGIGAGFARYGYDVTLVDVKDEFLSVALSKVKEEFDRCVEAGLMTKQQAENSSRRIRTVLDLKEAAANADLVIEAIVEKMDIKRQVFSDLDHLAPSHCILASNTSGFPISQLAACTKRPDKVIDTHF